VSRPSTCCCVADVYGSWLQVTTQLQGGQLACHTAEVLDVSTEDGDDGSSLGGGGGGGGIRALAFCQALGRAAVLSADMLHTFLPAPKAGWAHMLSLQSTAVHLCCKRMAEVGTFGCAWYA
jgi:hypothetical protein